MLAIPQRSLWLLFGAAASLCLGACSTVTDSTRSALEKITPYRVEVVQGNFVSREQVAALKTGMSRQQVREVLGTSLLTDVFHSDRWDYVFTMRRQGVEPQQRRLTVFFKNDAMDRVEGDTMPSEEEFVAAVDTRSGKTPKIPQLEATDSQLEKFKPDDKKSDTPAASAAPLAPLPPSYPPLETAR